MTHCFDPECNAAVSKELHGYPMCLEHYVEALEHSAHMVIVEHPKSVAKDISIQVWRLQRSKLQYDVWLNKKRAEATQP